MRETGLGAASWEEAGQRHLLREGRQDLGSRGCQGTAGRTGKEVLRTRARNVSHSMQASETRSTAVWSPSRREAGVEGRIASSLLGLLKQDAGVMSKSRCPRSFGNTNNLAGGVSLKPQGEEREHSGTDRVSEQSVDSLQKRTVSRIRRGRLAGLDSSSPDFLHLLAPEKKGGQ